jgi:hypothetical protein
VRARIEREQLRGHAVRHARAQLAVAGLAVERKGGALQDARQRAQRAAAARLLEQLLRAACGLWRGRRCARRRRGRERAARAAGGVAQQRPGQQQHGVRAAALRRRGCRRTDGREKDGVRGKVGMDGAYFGRRLLPPNPVPPRLPRPAIPTLARLTAASRCDRGRQVGVLRQPPKPRRGAAAARRALAAAARRERRRGGQQHQVLLLLERVRRARPRGAHAARRRTQQLHHLRDARGLERPGRREQHRVQ